MPTAESWRWKGVGRFLGMGGVGSQRRWVVHRSMSEDSCGGVAAVLSPGVCVPVPSDSESLGTAFFAGAGMKEQR
ncbi:hypothetical protein Mame01_56590 [Microbispora amethystogenes]|nr:hypothetical protein Mame01_56590 [Microbispora amethystogenes]